MKKSKKTGFILLILAIVLGLGAAGLTYGMIRNSYKEESVLVAKVDIEEGDPITSDLFEVKGVHPSGVPEGAANADDVDFNGVVSSGKLLKGDILRDNHIVKINDSEQELPLISTRVKAIGDDQLIGAEIPYQSISGILNGIKKGDMVTIVSVRENPESKAIESKTILVNIEVLAVRGDEEESSDSVTSGSDSVVAVALTQEQFKTLSLARDLGNIHIAVQPLGVEIDESIVEDFYSVSSSQANFNKGSNNGEDGE